MRFTLVAFTFLFSCRGAPTTDNDLVVSAAMSLKGPMEGIAGLYHKEHTAVEIHFNFASSGLLASQIEQGAPVDVYASASMRFLDELEKQDLLLAGTRRLLARNRLVVIVPVDSGLTVTDGSELESVESLALGNPKTVPAGAYAKEFLESINLWEKLQPRLILAEHVRQVLDYVARSEVTAGLVYATDAETLPDRVEVVAQTPEASHSAILYGIAVVEASTAPDAARRFAELATSPEGVRILESFGFIRPEP